MMFRDASKVRQMVQGGFCHGPIMVAGDLMLDRYFWGEVERISPEAPVPVVRIDHTTYAPGGAANVAANLRGLGCSASLIGPVGADEDGQRLIHLLQTAGADTTGVVSTPGRPTICKTRIHGGRQQMLRLDIERAGELAAEVQERLVGSVKAQLPGAWAIILSDYGKGTLSDSVCQRIIEYARERCIPVFIDPKGLDYKKYAGASALCPNRLELATATAVSSVELELLLERGQQLRSDLRIDYLVATLGELGIALLDDSGTHRFPALAREVFDVSGAGDTVIATLGAALAGGLDLHDAIRLANLAAGVVIRKVGTVPISKDELLASIASDEARVQTGKIWTFESLLRRVAEWRVDGRRVVFTNGCFDLFHAGHLSFLEQAKREGDCLVVALNTDRSVRLLKGPGRPIITEDARAKLVAALPYVDAVVLFDEDTPLNLIRALRPNVLVKGGNYVEAEVVGGNEMKHWGGRVAVIPLVDGLSTRAILKRAAASVAEASRPLIQ
jgi:D-beta-D-heptose 7-phosphate kinase/D-beta-D-heptose 1-phosphate adenosyltransferase